ncbi:hypothetical protein RFI_07200, partial [Reticulomyxa filosa]
MDALPVPGCPLGFFPPSLEKLNCSEKKLGEEDEGKKTLVYSLEQVKNELEMQLQERRAFEKQKEIPPPFYLNSTQLKIITSLSNHKNKLGHSVTLTTTEKLELRKQQLHNNKKLMLVLDLDHTLVHATKNPKAKELSQTHNPLSPFSDIHEIVFPQQNKDGKMEMVWSKNTKKKFQFLNIRFTHNTSTSFLFPFAIWHAFLFFHSNFSFILSIFMLLYLLVTPYWIKERPHLRTFLNVLRKDFDLAIYTMGIKSYVDEVLKIIDPTEEIFKQCVITREIHEQKYNLMKSNGQPSKGAAMEKSRLKRLSNLTIPCDESMTMVVDDTIQVWNSPGHVVSVPKFEFFPQGQEEGKNGDECEWNISNLLQRNNCNILLNVSNLLQAIHRVYYYPTVIAEAESRTLAFGMSDYLIQCQILNLHDCSVIYKQMKQMVFEKCVVAFAGAISKKSKLPQDDQLWKLVESHGGKCIDHLNDSVTHLICRSQTMTAQMSVCQSRFARVKMVHWTWVCQSIHALKPLDTSLFQLSNPPCVPVTTAMTLIDASDLSNRYVSKFGLKKNEVPSYLKDQIDVNKIQSMRCVAYLERVFNSKKSNEQDTETQKGKEKEEEQDKDKNKSNCTLSQTPARSIPSTIINISNNRRALRRPQATSNPRTASTTVAAVAVAVTAGTPEIQKKIKVLADDEHKSNNDSSCSKVGLKSKPTNAQQKTPSAVAKHFNVNTSTNAIATKLSISNIESHNKHGPSEYSPIPDVIKKIDNMCDSPSLNGRQQLGFEAAKKNLETSVKCLVQCYLEFHAKNAKKWASLTEICQYLCKQDISPIMLETLQICPNANQCACLLDIPCVISKVVNGQLWLAVEQQVESRLPSSLVAQNQNMAAIIVPFTNSHKHASVRKRKLQEMTSRIDQREILGEPLKVMRYLHY